jgi:hypothetical protein
MMELLNTIALRGPEEIYCLEEEFYQRKFYFSYSSLSRLLWNPYTFYKEYVLQKKEKKTDKHLIEGKVIHALLLSIKHFDKYFLVMPTRKMPGENTKLIVDRIFFKYLEYERTGNGRAVPVLLQDYRPEIIALLQEINLHQSLVDDKPGKTGGVLKTGDDKRMDKILTPDALEYWDFLLKKGNKDIIDQSTLDFCNKAVEKVRAIPRVMELLGIRMEEFANIEVHNEIALTYDLQNYVFGLQGIIDNLIIDHDKQVIKINDIKTTSKDLKDFQEAVEFYSYWAQAVIYVLLVARKYQHLISGQDGAPRYRIEFRFIVIDRNHNVYPFPVSQETMSGWRERFNNECLFKANYHYTQRQYSLPYEFAEAQIVL